MLSGSKSAWHADIEPQIDAERPQHCGTALVHWNALARHTWRPFDIGPEPYEINELSTVEHYGTPR